MYAKVNDGVVVKYPYSVSQLKLDNPTVSFPDPLGDDVAAEFGAVVVVTASTPTYDPVEQNCEEATPQFLNGNWTQVWVVTDASQEEIAERTDLKAAEVRATRNQRLSSCDWTMLPDAPVDKQAWAAYRQQLRDITAQPGFPLSIVWPEPPAS